MNFTPNEEQQAILYLKGIFKANRNAKIEKVTRSKSLSQNAYIWLVFTHIGFQVGSSKDDMYLYYLQKFPKFKEITTPENKIGFIALTLSGFNSDQTRQFIDEIVTHANCEGMDVPDPENKKALDMYNYYKEKGLL